MAPGTWPRAVKQALGVHGHVVAQLGALDGDHAEPHRDQVEMREGAAVLRGTLDAPIRIRLEVETLAAEQFGDDAFELRLWRERETFIFENDISVPRNIRTLGGIAGKKEGEKRRGFPGPISLTKQASFHLSLIPEEAGGVGPFRFL